MTTSRKGLWTGIGLLCFLLALLLWKSVDETEKAVHSVKARKSSRPSDSSEEERRRKPVPREVLAKRSAEDEALEAKHFRNFFLRSVTFGEMRPTPEEEARRLKPLRIALDPVTGKPLFEIAGMTGTAQKRPPVSLSTALERVKEEYRAVAKETREGTLPLAIDLTIADTSKSINLRTPRAPVISVLRLLAAVSGNRLVGSGPDFRMEAIPNDGRKLSFNEEFAAFDLSRLVNFGEIGNPDEMETDNERLGENPPERDLLDTLKGMGFQFDSALQVSLTRTPGGKSVIDASNASARDLELLRAALAVASSDAPLMQTKFTSKVIRLPASVEWNQETAFSIDAADSQQLLRGFASHAGSELMTMPSMVTRSGEISTIEIGSQPSDSKSPGVKITYNSQPLGTGTEDAYRLIQTRAASASQTEPGISQITGRSIGNGDSVQYTSAKDANGDHLIFIHARGRVDSTGRSVETGRTPTQGP